jgi:formylglycine-generating enzyme required for sulfatase activity
MGNRNGEIDEKPTREVQVRSFYMGKFEVTQAQWQAIMGKNPSGNNLCEDCPIENISWIEVQDFIKRLNILTGKNYRLPTEVEWEYAAKGGIKTRSSNYCGSDSLDLVAIYNGTNQTWKVGTKISNELGIYDMSGNVWEWCQDWYNKYSKAENSNIETNSNLVKVIRGGCWYSLANSCRPTSRSANYILSKSDAIGFRLVLPID